jgi:hypothetical protein
MTDEQLQRIHDIEYSCDSREELAERIVALEDENAKLRKLLSSALIVAGFSGRQYLDEYLNEEEGTTLWQELKGLGIEVDG